MFSLVDDLHPKTFPLRDSHRLPGEIVRVTQIPLLLSVYCWWPSDFNMMCLLYMRGGKALIAVAYGGLFAELLALHQGCAVTCVRCRVA